MALVPEDWLGKHKSRIPMKPRPQQSGAFSLAELLVVVVVIGILAALLLSVLSHQVRNAKRTPCANNQRQLLLADLLYAADDSHGSFGGTRFGPGNGVKPNFWPYIDENWLYPYTQNSLQVFFCPSTLNGEHPGHVGHTSTWIQLLSPASNRGSHGYSYDPLLWFADMEDYWNGNDNNAETSRFVPKTTSNINTYTHQNEAYGLQGKAVGPSQIWSFTDNDIRTGDKFWPDSFNNHGAEGGNTVFADGHVEWIRRRDYVYKYEVSQDNNRTKAIPRPEL